MNQIVCVRGLRIISLGTVACMPTSQLTWRVFMRRPGIGLLLAVVLVLTLIVWILFTHVVRLATSNSNMQAS